MIDFLKFLSFLKKNNKKANTNTQVETLIFRENNFAAREAYKLLRANVMFALPDDKPCRIIGVTSPMRAEGKSTTSINLSYVLAEAGKRVLLIDADLRLPSVAKKLDISDTPGLSETLIKPEFTGEEIKNFELKNLSVLTSGRIPPNPSEMLGSRKMQSLLEVLSESYDFIIVDLPPVNVVSDALVIAPLLDGMLVVVRGNHTSGRELNKCVRSLELSKVKVLGIVINAKSNSSGAYSLKHKYYKYYKKRDYYSKSYGYADYESAGREDDD